MENELPEGWIQSTIENCTVILDNLRQPINAQERAKKEGDIPYYGATGQAGWIDDFIFDEELVLLGEDGAPFFDKKKNVAFLISGKSWVNNHAHVLKARNEITTNDFILHYFNHFDYTDFVGGTTRLKLNQGSLKEIPIPLPPLAEQTRIVAKLDTAFGHLETLKTSLARIPELLKKFRQTVLTQAVTGKLTEEWREMQLKFTKQNTLLKKNSLFKENEPGICEGWTRSSVAEIAEMISGYAFKSDEFTSSGIQVVRMGNLYQDKLNLDRNPVYLPENFDPKLTKKYSAKPGDILLSLTGTKYKRDYGYAILVPELEAPILINQRILCLRPVVNKHFLLYMLRDNLFRDQFFAFETGAVNQGNVGSTAVEKIELDIPSVEEQQEIVSRVEALFAKVDALDAQYQSLKAMIEQLPQALLAKAFQGELVPQNPTDEPASVLLERIKMAATNSPVKGIREGRTKTADVIGTKQTRKRMKGKPVKTLPEFVDRLTQLGGKAEPKQLLIEFDLQEDVDSFFELLRDGKAQGLLNVPTGAGGPIELA